MLILKSSNRAGQVWRQFADAWGPEVMLNAYDWRQPPAETRPLELFYECYADDQLAGWGSLTKHPLGNEYFLSVGIFPASTRKNLYRPLNRLLVEEAFRLGAKQVHSCIFTANAKLLERVLKHCEEDGWMFAGEVWYPEPSYKIFTTTRELCPGCEQVLDYCKCCGGQGFVFDH